jgi:hypothetical protein
MSPLRPRLYAYSADPYEPPGYASLEIRARCEGCRRRQTPEAVRVVYFERLPRPGNE